MINTEMIQPEHKNTGMGLPFFEVQFTNWVIFVILILLFFERGGGGVG